ncbi:MAG: alpha/beta hydrolase [Planctomycetia bacterium]
MPLHHRSAVVALLFCAVGFAPTASSAARADEPYKLGPDSQRNADVPKGKIEKFEWKSTIFPGTVRDCWTYVPAQYNAKTPAAVMVFQDGGNYMRDEGEFRVPIVLDNLIARGELPVIVAVFVNPGVAPASDPKAKPRLNRSFEYDSLGDQYARFLLEEILPEVGKKVNLTTDPEGRAIGGISSGGICAWTVAWERPDEFRKVLSHVGSFTNIRGGHVCHALVRKTEKKPIRIFMQDGSGDLDNLHGNWPLANQEMAAALKFAGYDYKFEFGVGGHNGKHGGALMPESLKWLWRDYKPKTDAEK